MMIRVLPIALLLCWAATAQRGGRINHVRIPLDETAFGSCASVEEFARAFDPGLRDHIYTLELYTRDKGSPAAPFASERHLNSVTQLVARQRPLTFPIAMFYSIDGRYHFRCRDASNRETDKAGSAGDPLQLPTRTGRAEILHFDLWNNYMAHVYVVTGTSLNDIGGEALLAQVTQLLKAHYVFLYVRQDPWFLEYSLDPAPFIFADASKAISDEVYRATQTLICETGHACHLASAR